MGWQWVTMSERRSELKAERPPKPSKEVNHKRAKHPKPPIRSQQTYYQPQDPTYALSAPLPVTYDPYPSQTKEMSPGPPLQFPYTRSRANRLLQLPRDGPSPFPRQPAQAYAAATQRHLRETSRWGSGRPCPDIYGYEAKGPPGCHGIYSQDADTRSRNKKKGARKALRSQSTARCEWPLGRSYDRPDRTRLAKSCESGAQSKPAEKFERERSRRRQ